MADKKPLRDSDSLDKILEQGSNTDDNTDVLDLNVGDDELDSTASAGSATTVVSPPAAVSFTAEVPSMPAQVDIRTLPGYQPYEQTEAERKAEEELRKKTLARRDANLRRGPAYSGAPESRDSGLGSEPESGARRGSEAAKKKATGSSGSQTKRKVKSVVVVPPSKNRVIRPFFNPGSGPSCGYRHVQRPSASGAMAVSVGGCAPPVAAAPPLPGAGDFLRLNDELARVLPGWTPDLWTHLIEAAKAKKPEASKRPNYLVDDPPGAKKFGQFTNSAEVNKAVKELSKLLFELLAQNADRITEPDFTASADWTIFTRIVTRLFGSLSPLGYASYSTLLNQQGSVRQFLLGNPRAAAHFLPGNSDASSAADDDDDNTANPAGGAAKPAKKPAPKKD